MFKWIVIVALTLTAAALGAQDQSDKRIAELEERVRKLEQQDKDEEQDQPEEPQGDVWFKRYGNTTVRVMKIGVEGLFAAGLSSAQDEEIEALQLGHHDPKRRGFTIQQVELAFSGAVDPYFRLQAYILFGEEGVELEEAFMTTVDLPGGLEIKGGYFLSAFGIMNPTHPHAWEFVDQPVALGRVLGPDGARGAGVQVAWQLPAPWYSELFGSVQNSWDGTLLSFRGEGHHHEHAEEEHGEETIGEWPAVERETESLLDLAYLLGWYNRFEFSDQVRAAMGLTGMFGPNRSGDRGKTWLAGVDASLWFNPQGTEDGDVFLRLQGEFVYRYFQADSAVVLNDPVDPADDEFLDSTVLGDWGGYLQLVAGWYAGFSFGLRAEFAASYRDGHLANQDDPMRDRRFRLSPLVAWEISTYARVRLQYNLDTMQHLEDPVHHSVWLSLQVSIGAGAH